MRFDLRRDGKLYDGVKPEVSVRTGECRLKVFVDDAGQIRSPLLTRCYLEEAR